MTSKQTYILDGIGKILPILPGILPFGLIVGIQSREMGWSVWEACGLSVFVFAGAAQLAVLDLFAQQAILPVTVITALMINLRFSMYSASLAPYFSGLSVPWRCGYAYILSDQAYGLYISAAEINDDANLHWSFFAMGFALWLTWQLATVAGYYTGQIIPASWQLGFTIPLMFMTLMVMAIKSPASVLAAMVGGVVAVLLKFLPYNLGFIIASICGIATGFMVETLTTAKSGE